MNIKVIAYSTLSLALIGCVSAERKAEYREWMSSADARQVSLEEFELRYKEGWRVRAVEKEKSRLAREEYEAWLKSDDAVTGVEMTAFEKQYKEGWRGRAEEKKRVRLAKEKVERDRIAKEKEEARRAQLAKEAAEKAERARLAQRTELYEKTISQTLEDIRMCYVASLSYANPFLPDKSYEAKKEKIQWFVKEYPNKSIPDLFKGDKNVPSDWLAKWSSSRLGLSEPDAHAGEALLSSFGKKYLPNAYADYEKKRESLAEIQKIFNEEFPEPSSIKNTSPKWNSFNKVLERFVKARTECFFCHDELCHYWLMSRFGVLADEDFKTIDGKRLAVHLLPENIERANYTFVKLNECEGNVAEFSAKYAPESNAIYTKLMQEFKAHDALLSEVSQQYILLDGARYSRVFDAAVQKRNDMVRVLNRLLFQQQCWHMDHKMAEKSSDEIAKSDSIEVRQMKCFIDALPSYIKDHVSGPVIANADMVHVPEGAFKWIHKHHESYGRMPQVKAFKMQRAELTQMQWMIVMGNNPSRYRGPDRPVENVSWDECQEFIRAVSAVDGCQYRLPTEVEWEYACRAGSDGDWGKRSNGECGPLEAMGWFGESNDDDWYSATGNGTHAVAMKEPNSFGLYDMHGNVWEWCQDAIHTAGDSAVHVPMRGGSLIEIEECCTAVHRAEGYRSFKNERWPCCDRGPGGILRDFVGFRLIEGGDIKEVRAGTNSQVDQHPRRGNRRRTVKTSK